MGYLFFNADRGDDFDTDGEGTEGTLGEHLEYLDNYGGSPDCWDSTDTDSRTKAIHEARESNMHLYVVDEYTYRVVGHVNAPEEK
jgi:hypothetical protein